MASDCGGGSGAADPRAPGAAPKAGIDQPTRAGWGRLGEAGHGAAAWLGRCSVSLPDVDCVEQVFCAGGGVYVGHLGPKRRRMPAVTPLAGIAGDAALGECVVVAVLSRWLNVFNGAGFW